MKYSWVTVNPETSKPTTLSALESIITFGAQTEWYADACIEFAALRMQVETARGHVAMARDYLKTIPGFEDCELVRRYTAWLTENAPKEEQP